MRFLPLFLFFVLTLSVLPGSVFGGCPPGTAPAAPDGSDIEETSFLLESAIHGPARSLHQWTPPSETVLGEDGKPKKVPKEVCLAVVKKEPDGLTRDEVAPHDKPDDCYMIINDAVFDMTSYMSLNQHPGKNDVLLPLCGKDATKPFLDQHAGKQGMLYSFQNLVVGSVVFTEEEIAEEARNMLERQLNPEVAPKTSWSKFVPKAAPAPPKPTPAPAPAPVPAPPPKPATSKWQSFTKPPVATPSPAPAPTRSPAAPVPTPTPAPTPARSDSRNSVAVDKNVNKNTVITKIIPKKDDRPVEKNEDSLLVNDLTAPLPPIVQAPAPAPAAARASAANSNSNRVVSTTTTRTSRSSQTYVIGPDGKLVAVPVNTEADALSAVTADEINENDQAQPVEPVVSDSPSSASSRASRRSSWFQRRPSFSSRSRPVHVAVEVQL